MKLKKKITIITPTFNSSKTILTNLKSVKNQKYKNFEHLIIDKNSNDGTKNLVKKENNKKIRIISEKDNGIYDAINKGIKLAKGEIISILHSDDVYYSDQTLLKVVKAFEGNKVDIVYGNLLYVNKSNLDKIIRFWKSNNYSKGKFSKGWSPPHPAFFVTRKMYEKFGFYNTTIGNPPYVPRGLCWKFFQRAMETTTDRIFYLVNASIINVFTPNRLDEMKKNKWFIQSFHIVQDKRWFGRYMMLELGREDKGLYSWKSGKCF